ncbi:MAG: hypothetical protein Q7S92_04720 [Candidatus Diapherotrites archaeon]|nr:hypothetical protein [Candidatus Diapherotrites archaeon]
MPGKGKSQSAVTRSKISLARKALLAKNRPALIRRNRQLAVERLRALLANHESINSRYIRDRHPRLYDLIRRAFGSHEQAVVKGLKMDYDQVRVSVDERSKRVRAGWKKQWSEADLKKRRKIMHALRRRRRIVNRLQNISFISKLLELRLQGWHHSLVAKRLNIAEKTWQIWSSRVIHTVSPELREHWKAIARAIQYEKITSILNGSPAVSWNEAQAIAAKFKKTELKKFSENRRKIYRLALTGKSIPELAGELNVSEKEAVALVNMLSFEQSEKIKKKWLRQSLERVRAERTVQP